MDCTKVYLVQTDTTVGFSSSNDEKLSVVKQRPISQKILQTVDSFKTLKQLTRIPKKFKKKVRNSAQTTFIYPNKKSFRVVSKESHYYDFIKKFNSIYSTSANLSGYTYDEDFALNKAEVIVLNNEGFSNKSSSRMIKISKNKAKKIR